MHALVSRAPVTGKHASFRFQASDLQIHEACLLADACASILLTLSDRCNSERAHCEAPTHALCDNIKYVFKADIRDNNQHSIPNLEQLHHTHFNKLQQSNAHVAIAT
jgi:hypothetical protein